MRILIYIFILILAGCNASDHICDCSSDNTKLRSLFYEEGEKMRTLLNEVSDARLNYTIKLSSDSSEYYKKLYEEKVTQCSTTYYTIDIIYKKMYPDKK